LKLLNRVGICQLCFRAGLTVNHPKVPLQGYVSTGKIVPVKLAAAVPEQSLRIGKVTLTIAIRGGTILLGAPFSQLESWSLSMMPAVVFVALNIADAYLTRISLMSGAIEINPLMTSIGSSMISKGLIGVAVALALYFFGKERMLWLLNIALFGILLWNSATYLIIDFWPLHSLIGTHAGF
jgi:hypothetical protein